MANDEGLLKYADAVGCGTNHNYRTPNQVALDFIREELNKMSENKESTNFASGAVRSADANHLDFMSLPLIGLIGAARTAAEGGTKYGRLNYARGMPVHDLLNHAFRHLVMFSLGDRSEPHLEHAAWGVMAAIQSNTLDPDLSLPHMFGPGVTISPEVRQHLDDLAPKLAKQRRDGDFDDIGDWDIKQLPEIIRLLEQRRKATITKE